MCYVLSAKRWRHNLLSFTSPLKSFSALSSKILYVPFSIEFSEKMKRHASVILNLIQDPRFHRYWYLSIPDQVQNDIGFSANPILNFRHLHDGLKEYRL